MNLTSLLLMIAGSGALAASMRRHAAQIGFSAIPAGRLRVAGCVLLAVSLIALLEQMNWRMAIIASIGQAGLAAALCVGTLTLKPRALPMLCGLAGIYGLAILIY